MDNMTILIFHKFIRAFTSTAFSAHLGSVCLRWCKCNHLTSMRTKSAGRDLPEQLVSVCFQKNPGMVHLRCESERTLVRYSSKKHTPLWKGENESWLNNVCWILGRHPHKTLWTGPQLYETNQYHNEWIPLDIHDYLLSQTLSPTHPRPATPMHLARAGPDQFGALGKIFAGAPLPLWIAQ